MSESKSNTSDGVMVEQSSSVAGRGKTTIPKPIRQALNIEDGDRVIFKLKDDWTVVFEHE